MGKSRSVGIIWVGFFMLLLNAEVLKAQCTSSDILDPGFRFLTNSRGCAPFNVQLQTEYLSSTIGTTYYVDWGDGTPEEIYTQTSTAGVILQHTYPNSPVECGYDVIIDASNVCNPRGSVTPIETQVLVWTNDVISINPQVFRVCQGFAQELQFTDDSDWNCFPRDTRENSDARWIQWIYGTGDPAIRIPNITIENASPATYPYKDPNPAHNPYYPVLNPGQTTSPIQIPVTTAADLGKEFEITLRNWNQCNPYDNDVTDGNGLNPISGDFSNGDNDPMVTEARIIIVAAPEPDFQTRAGDSNGELKDHFCIDDEIYFENLTPSISGSNFQYTWEFFDNADGSGDPLNTSNVENPTYSFEVAGTKLIRLRVSDQNAAGNCVEVFEKQVFISPLLQALIGVTDINDNPITPVFCQASEEAFTVRFHDESFGTVTNDIKWRWEFYDENNSLIQSEPTGTGFSANPLGPFDMEYQQEGEYKVKLIVLDEVTGCTSDDIATVKINPSPTADFTSSIECFSDSTMISDASSVPTGQSIVSWAYDIHNDGDIDTSFTNPEDWKYLFEDTGNIPVKLIVTSALGCADSIIKNIEVKPLPEAIITADNLTGCSEFLVTIQNESWQQSQNIDSYQWEINNGNGFEVDSIQSPSDEGFDGTFTKKLINNTTGDKAFQVRLRAFGENGCSSVSNTLDVTVTPGATSGFLYTNYSPFNNNCSPKEIHFAVDEETQLLNPGGYNWNIAIEDSVIFDDTTTDPELTYTFNNETGSVQQYAIKLTTLLGDDCSSDSVVFVNINPIPSAQFKIDTLLYTCDQMELRFSSVQKGLSRYKWDLRINSVLVYSNDGSQDYFDYTFDRTSNDVNFEVSLTTRNLANCSSDEVINNGIIPQINNFNASFTLSSNTVSLPDATVSISDGSTPGDWEYLWDFGNGETSTDPDLTSFTYSEVGDYTILLTISDGYCTTSYSQNMKVVSPPPTAGFSFDPQAGCLPHKVSFTNQSAHAVRYEWDFGDGSSSILEHPQHTYTTPGIYSVTLTAYGHNDEKVYEFKEDIIEVFSRPVAYFEVRPDHVYLPDMPIHTRNLSQGATGFLWHFDDGTVSDQFQPQHIYEEPGQFDVTLQAFNEYCSDSLTLKDVVTAEAVGRILIPNAFSPSKSGPGGSGENDVFVPLLAEVSEYQLQIYNRWGELLFEGFNQGWDGYYQGRLCAQDVYVYKLEVVFNSGEKGTKIGDVNLIR